MELREVRSKNSKPLDALESAYMADVKRCACAGCGSPPPSSAHHPQQGLHMIAVSLCWGCHQGPHGWHGDKAIWRAIKVTELKAINTTRRMVEQLRAGITTLSTTRRASKPVKSSTYERSPKIHPRKSECSQSVL